MQNTKASMVLGLALLGALLTSCDDEKKTASPRTDGGKLSDKSALDPDLAEAVAAASAGARRGGAPNSTQGGPPPNGVFGPGMADKELPRGASARITLGSDGSEPRVLLSDAQPKPGTKRSGTMQLQLTTGPRQGLPPIEFGLAFQAQKPPAAPAAEGVQPAATSVSAEAPEQVYMLVNVASVKLVEAASVPKEFGTELGKLKGSRIEYRVSRNGAGNDFRYNLAKDADPGLDNALRSLTEAIATMTLPFPDKPLGNGAFFMATTRESAVGVDVVAYRLVKVTAVNNDKVTLSVNTKRYATTSKFEMPGLPQDMGALTLEEFRSTADGTMDIIKGTPFPTSSELTQVLNAGISAAKQPDQRMAIQAQAHAEFALGGGTPGASGGAKSARPQPPLPEEP